MSHVCITRNEEGAYFFSLQPRYCNTGSRNRRAKCTRPSENMSTDLFAVFSPEVVGIFDLPAEGLFSQLASFHPKASLTPITLQESGFRNIEL